jgi:hypothetical protein
LFDTDSTAAPPGSVEDLHLTPEALGLNRAFAAIDDPRLRSHVVELVQSIADFEGGDGTALKRLRRRNGTAGDR